mmetsp:Transcript_29050/g.28013  ORF Transcript_29050/g.28013 Transcript_29050/m.28013 type:complete len:124 (+) Transcript_29050:188-559(+)|eukprot:CAMPEP_0170545946 /NCGR_PEP_ID=MMETSP0211-20121228/4321_1 /TAXON_ID=311385 /ORGANISM="Pseudokeronopsis sp., Strain OXSARD2" /LENGTH=123 /DNA_ID=CAMNT_0010850129 /DNA_START=190 /DNA_END=561 /DNA_ORIENTATION=-
MSTIKTCFSNAFMKTNNDFKHHLLDTLLSGSTLSTIIVHLDYIYAANVGDSKMVVFVMPKNKGGSSSSTNLGTRNAVRLGKKGLIQEDYKFEETDNYLSVSITKSGHEKAPGTPKLDQSYKSG